MALPRPDRPRFRGSLAQFIAQAGPGNKNPVALEAAYLRATGRRPPGAQRLGTPQRASYPGAPTDPSTGRPYPLSHRGGTGYGVPYLGRGSAAATRAAGSLPETAALPAVPPSGPPSTPAPADGLALAARNFYSQYGTDTTAGQNFIKGAYDSVAANARTDNASAQAQIAALAGLAGSGYADGSVQDQAAKQQATTLAAISASSGSRFPAVLESAGANEAKSYGVARAGALAEFDANQYQADAARFKAGQENELGYAKLTADNLSNRQQIALTARGQNLSLLAAKLSAGGSLTRAELAAETQLATNQQDNETSQANTQTRTAAQERIAAKRQAAADKKAAAKAKKERKAAAGRPGTPQYASARTSYANNLRKDFFRDQPDFQTDAQGNVVTDTNGKPIKSGTTSSQTYNTDAQPSIIRGLSLGLRPVHILTALRGVDPGYGSDRRDIAEFISALQQGGYRAPVAKNIARSLFGNDLSAPGIPRSIW